MQNVCGGVVHSLFSVCTVLCVHVHNTALCALMFMVGIFCRTSCWSRISTILLLSLVTVAMGNDACKSIIILSQFLQCYHVRVPILSIRVFFIFQVIQNYSMKLS